MNTVKAILVTAALCFIAAVMAGGIVHVAVPLGHSFARLMMGGT